MARKAPLVDRLHTMAVHEVPSRLCDLFPGTVGACVMGAYPGVWRTARTHVLDVAANRTTADEKPWFAHQGIPGSPRLPKNFVRAIVLGVHTADFVEFGRS